MKNLGQIDYKSLTRVTQQDLDEGVWDAEQKGLYSKDGKRFLQYVRPQSLPHGTLDTFQLKSGVEVICDGDLQVIAVQRIEGLAHQLIGLAESIGRMRYCLRLRPCGSGGQLVIDRAGQRVPVVQRGTTAG